MARPRIDTNAIAKRIAEGRGKGHGRYYRPWLSARDVPSIGLTSRIPGRITGRVHHVFSNLEADCCYLVDFNPNVVDIREQFPLLAPDNTLDETRQIAADLAIACKPASKLADPRVLEKLEIERRYWAARDVAWGVVTERELPRATVESVRWIVGVGGVDGVVAPDRVERLTAHLRACVVAQPGVALADVCAAEDDCLGLRLGSCLTLARHALATKAWVVDLSDGRTAVRPDLPLPPLRPYTTAHGVWCERAEALVSPPAAPPPPLPPPARTTPLLPPAPEAP